MALTLGRLLVNNGFRRSVHHITLNSMKGQRFCSAISKEERKSTVPGGTVISERRGTVMLIGINRPEARNAVNQETAQRLTEELSAFDQDNSLNVAVLYGIGGTFCAGFDLKELAQTSGSLKVEQDVCSDGRGPMGPSRMRLSKPLIAAVSGYAVAGGLELALLADLRVVEESSIMGVFCRRFAARLRAIIMTLSFIKPSIRALPACSCEPVPQTVCLYGTRATQEDTTPTVFKSVPVLYSNG